MAIGELQLPNLFLFYLSCFFVIPGNHEAGGIYRPYETMAPYFEAYFPHRDSVVLGEMNRYGRKVRRTD